MRGVQYHGGYHDKCGDILSTVGVFSTMGDIMILVGVIMSTVGGNLLLFEYPRVLNTPTVLMISPTVLKFQRMVSPRY